MSHKNLASNSSSVSGPSASASGASSSHGVPIPSPMSIEQTLKTAQHSPLSADAIIDLLVNFVTYGFRFSASAAEKPSEGALYLYEQSVLQQWLADPLSSRVWKLRKNGFVNHQLTIGYMFHENSSLARRIYWLQSREAICLVHYLPVVAGDNYPPPQAVHIEPTPPLSLPGISTAPTVSYPQLVSDDVLNSYLPMFSGDLDSLSLSDVMMLAGVSPSHNAAHAGGAGAGSPLPKLLPSSASVVPSSRAAASAFPTVKQDPGGIGMDDVLFAKAFSNPSSFGSPPMGSVLSMTDVDFPPLMASLPGSPTGSALSSAGGLSAPLSPADSVSANSNPSSAVSPSASMPSALPHLSTAPSAFSKIQVSSANLQSSTQSNPFTSGPSNPFNTSFDWSAPPSTSSLLTSVLGQNHGNSGQLTAAASASLWNSLGNAPVQSASQELVRKRSSTNSELSPPTSFSRLKVSGHQRAGSASQFETDTTYDENDEDDGADESESSSVSRSSSASKFAKIAKVLSVSSLGSSVGTSRRSSTLSTLSTASGTSSLPSVPGGMPSFLLSAASDGARPAPSSSFSATAAAAAAAAASIPEPTSPSSRSASDTSMRSRKAEIRARKAEVARACRRRKKAYIKAVEDKTTTLAARLTDIEAQEHYAQFAAIALHREEQQNLKKTVATLAQGNATMTGGPAAELAQAFENLRINQHVKIASLLENQLQTTEDTLAPDPVLQFLITGLAAAPVPTESSAKQSPAQGNPELYNTWQRLLNQLGLEQHQLQRLEELHGSAIESQLQLNTIRGYLAHLRVALNTYITQRLRFANSYATVFSPVQLANLLMWIEQNPMSTRPASGGASQDHGGANASGAGVAAVHAASGQSTPAVSATGTLAPSVSANLQESASSVRKSTRVTRRKSFKA